MVVVLLIWLYMAFTSFWMGNLAMYLLKLLFWVSSINASNNHKEQFIITTFIGLALITSIGSWLSLIVAAPFYTHVLIIVCILIYTFFKNKWNLKRGWRKCTVFCSDIYKQQPFLIILFLFALFGITLLLSVGDTLNGDSKLYHLQAIKWIENYRVVPGIANLIGPIGYNNHNFITQAIFSFPFLTALPHYVVNGFLMVMLCLYLLPTTYPLSKIDLLKLILLLFVISMRYAVPSPSPDFFANSYLFLAGLILAQKILDNKLLFFDIGTVIVLSFSLFLLTIKTSMVYIAPLFILGIVPNDSLKGSISRIFKIVILGLIILVPFFIRNIIISGYLIYPFYQFDFFNVDWKVPLEYTMIEKEFIRAGGFGNFGGFSNFNLIDYYKNVLINLGYVKLFMVLGLICTIIFQAIHISVSLLKKKIIFFAPLKLFFFWGIIYWAVLAPNPRFGYSQLVFFISLAFFDSLYLLGIKFDKFLNLYWSFITVFLILFVGSNITINNFNKLLKPGNYTTKNHEVNIVVKNGIKMYITSSKPVNHELPCIVNRFISPLPEERIVPRGDRIQDGFKMLPVEELNSDIIHIENIGELP